MKLPAVRLVIQHHFQKAKSLGKSLADKFEEEDIHNFRVEVKKLRAFLRLSASAPHAAVRARLARKLHAFYDMTGIIRVLQLQRNKLQEAALRLNQDIPLSCIAALDSRIDIATAMARLYLKLCAPLGKPSSRWHVPVSAHSLDRAAQTFIEERRKIILLPPGAVLPPDGQLHQIRKAIKDILHVWPYLTNSVTGQSLATGLYPGETLQTCAAWLGDFHDICIQLELLKDRNFLLSTVPQANKFLEHAGQLWHQDKEEKLEQIRSILTPAAGTLSGQPDNGSMTENPLAPVNLNAVSHELHVD
jgi:CHAD domain-containing protein